MSHQDKRRHSLPAYNHQALREALDWSLNAEVLSSVEFRKGCRWSPLSFVFNALLWAWSDEECLRQRFGTAWKIVQRAWHSAQRVAPSYQAFTKMLRRWTASLLVALAGHFRQQMQAKLPDRYQVGGWVVFAADGSRMELPRTVSNEQRFSPSSSRTKGKRPASGGRPQRNRGRKGKGQGRAAKVVRRRRRKARQALRSRQRKASSPQLWLTMVWHVGTQLPWDWRTGPSDSSEREHLLQMVNSLPKKALLTADAGFVGYEFWKEVLDSGRQFLIRVGANVRLLKALGYVREKKGLVYLWPDEVAAKRQPPLVLRLISVHNGKHPVYLVTSVLDERRLSDGQAVEIYRRRWGIEIFFRHLKQTFERRKLRSKSADNAQVEADWSLLGLWVMALHAEWKLAQAKVPIERISFAAILRAYRTAMREYKSRPDAGEDLSSLLRRALKDEYVRTSKASRDYPKKKDYGPPPGAPEIVQATRAQQRLAREVKGEQELRLTA